jgi:capsular exopolysaccharide synthesis family protein
MEQSPRYSTLSDYLRVIRRRWLVIVLFTAGLGAAALASSLSQEDTYEAEAQIEFRDIAVDLNLIAGTSPTPDIGAGARAATNAELITRPEVTKRVSRELDSELSEAEISDSISTRVGLQTNLVILTATADQPELAADIANAYAEVARKVGTKEAQALLGELEESAAAELEEADNRRNADSFRVGALQDRLSRIRTLQDVTEPVEIAESAAVPTTPVSPKPARNTALGLILGFTLGILAAFVRDALDRRLHGAHEVHEELGVPVLGRVSDRALMYPGLAATGSASPMAEAEFEAFRILRTNLKALSEDAPKAILVTSPRPGEGKTAVSLSLASAFAIAGQSVLLVECDLRRPSFARRLSINPTPGLTDYLTGSAAPKEILQVVKLSQPAGTVMGRNGAQAGDAGRIVCITAGTPTGMPAELLGSERFTEFLAKVRHAYDAIVLDASPLLSVVDPLDLALHVDGVLMCVRSGQTTRDEARASRAALSHLPDRPVGAVMTGLKRGGVDGYGYYYGY